MLTRHGWAAVVAAAGALLLGRLFGLLELYVVGSAVAVVILLAMAAVNRPLPALEVLRTARPATVAVGEPARVDLRVVNRTRRRTPRLWLWEPVGERGGAPMQLAPLGPGEAATAAYRVPTVQRGLVRTGPLRVQRSDALGLCRRTTWLAGSGELLVVPERVPLVFPSLTSSGPLGEHLRMKAMARAGVEFHSQREYVPGDDLRRVNWRSSARVGELIVRETAPEGVHRCLVVLDTDARGYDHDGFERAVSAAASVVSTADGAGVATRLAAPGIDLRGRDVAHESLRWLATVAPDAGGRALVPLGGAPADGQGLVVLVTASLSTVAADDVRAAKGPDDTLVVITTMSPPRDGGRFVVGATSLDELEHGWGRLVADRRTVVR